MLYAICTHTRQVHIRYLHTGDDAIIICTVKIIINNKLNNLFALNSIVFRSNAQLLIALFSVRISHILVVYQFTFY